MIRTKPILKTIYSLFKFLLKMGIVFISLIVIAIIGFTIYLNHTIKPQIPEFEQWKANYFTEYATTKWVALENLPPTIVNYYLSQEGSSSPSLPLLKTLDGYWCGLPSELIAEMKGEKRSSSNQQQMLWHFLRSQFYFFPDSPNFRPQKGMRAFYQCCTMVELEKQWTEQQITEAYLNSTYYGNRTYSTYAASQFYFKKAPKELNVYEVAILLAIPISPSSFAYKPESFIDRSCRILQELPIPEEEKDCTPLEGILKELSPSA